MISKGFAFVAFFSNEEASSVCIQPKNDLAATIQSQPWVEWRPTTLHKTNTVIKLKVTLFAVCQQWVKLDVLHSHHDGSP